MRRDFFVIYTLLSGITLSKGVIGTQVFSFFTEFVSKIIWGPALLFIVLGTGAVLTFATGFFPLRRAGFIIKSTFGRIFRSKKAFSATATALGATVGTGNIVGVASAIAIGGAGAVFWMWVGAFFGMMLKFSEAALAVKYRGGANVYIEKAFGKRQFSVLWCFCCIFASFGGGNMIQTYSAGAAFENSFGIPPVFIGTAIAVLSAAVVFCGAKAVTKVSSVLVPVMAMIYVIGCAILLFICRERVPAAFESIFASAFETDAVIGGTGGIVFSKALRVGVARGTFTHEAGMGSASLAHAESDEKNPLVQGCWGIVEVFIDTIFVCTLTALVLLSAGSGNFSENSAGEIFRQYFGKSGDVFIAVSMFLFALAAVIGWAFYGEKALLHITKSKFWVDLYRILFCFAAFCGSFLNADFIWNFTDIFNGLMIFPNIGAIIFLMPEILKITKGGSAD